MQSIAILKEGKTPPDRRVPLSPQQCVDFIAQYPSINLVVQRSPIRCFSDSEYSKLGITLVNDVSDCDVLLGVKEVPKADLLSNKTYFYFSHTIKEQPYNRELLQKMVKKNITMVDYEILKHANGNRIIGFGRYAGVVGCYNGFLAYGKRTKRFDLKVANLCEDRKELEQELKKVDLPNIKIIVSGNGRVGKGALEIIQLLNIRDVSKEDFNTIYTSSLRAHSIYLVDVNTNFTKVINKDRLRLDNRIRDLKYVESLGGHIVIFESIPSIALIKKQD